VISIAEGDEEQARNCACPGQFEGSLDARLSANSRLHWRNEDLIISLLLLITEIAPEPVSHRILQSSKKEVTMRLSYSYLNVEHIIWRSISQQTRMRKAMEQNQSITSKFDEANTRDTRTWAGAFLLFLPMIPIIATIICIATYLGLNLKAPAILTRIGWVDTVIPLLVGTVLTLVLWSILALLLRPLTAVDRASEKSYYALLDHLSTLNYYIDTKTIDTEEVMKNRESFCLALKEKSASWIVGNGYIELWDFMDSAEEALITVAPLEKVIADAVYDEMRLNDSKIVNSEEWVNKLRSAVYELDPNAVNYLKPAVGTQSLVTKAQTQQQTPANNQGGNAGIQQTGAQTQQQTPATGQGGNAGTQKDTEARAILRVVRETINDFNTRSWDALISARNQLYSTMTLVGLTVFVFVALAIIFHVNLLHLEAATFYAFIGGLAGLIGRLSIESQSDKTVDDYRLSLARLLVTPLLSSLAAVLGVLIVAKTTDLNMIYNFNTSMVPSLIIAATFGLSPNLLINQLQKKSEEYKGNLQSTQPTSGK